MTWADTLGNMRVLDTWRADIGLQYGFESPERRANTIDGRPLAAPTSPMRRRRLPALAKDISVVALGTGNLQTFTQAAILLDAFYERGGNLFDTAWIYGLGRAEALLGQWLTGARRARAGVAHRQGRAFAADLPGRHRPPTHPVARSAEHRPSSTSISCTATTRDIPVGEFVDAMDAEIRAGRIRACGGSNWTRERMDEAAAYARRAGRTAAGGALQQLLAGRDDRGPVGRMLRGLG